MAIRTQLTVFLENKIGILARMTESFKKSGINIEAISVSDSTDHSYIRMVVNDPIKARNLLEEHGTLVFDAPVLVVTLPDKPGLLHDVAIRLKNKKINIDYLYGSGTSNGNLVELVLHTDNLKAAEKALKM
jgi:hypothetical protein